VKLAEKSHEEFDTRFGIYCLDESVSEVLYRRDQWTLSYSNGCWRVGNIRDGNSMHCPSDTDDIESVSGTWKFGDENSPIDISLATLLEPGEKDAIVCRIEVNVVQTTS